MDDSKINMFGGDGIHRVWRKPDEAMNPVFEVISQTWMGPCDGVGHYGCQLI